MLTETVAETDESETESPAESRNAGKVKAAERQERASRGVTFSIGMRSILVGGVVAVLIVALSITIPLWLIARSELHDRDLAAAAQKHAESVASDYAIGASNIDYHNFDNWVHSLKSNTSPALSNKFDATAPQLKDIIVPLNWTSKATAISSALKSENAGVYVVNVFLNVTSTSAQTPEGAQTTVTYTVTVDKNSDWKITDVGGVDAALPAK